MPILPKGTDFVDAHTIPAGFFADCATGRRAKAADKQGGRGYASDPKGVYDRTILGSCCERRFGPWDQHAQRFCSTIR